MTTYIGHDNPDAIETADRTRPPGLEAKTARLYEKIAKLRQQMRGLHQVKEQLKKQPDSQLSLTDTDSRSMTSDGKGTGTPGTVFSRKSTEGATG